MKTFEKQLKLLIEQSEGGCDPVYVPESGLSEADIRFLSGKGLVLLEPAGDDEFYAILSPKGITYFSDKQEERAKFYREKLFSFLGGVLSGFISGILVTLAVEYLLG